MFASELQILHKDGPEEGEHDNEPHGKNIPYLKVSN